LALLIGASPSALATRANATEAAPTGGGGETGARAEIVVTAPIELLRGIAERRLESSDVEAYGLDTVGEVIEEVAGEDGENPDDVIFLVNGKRVTGVENVQDLPAEAIASIDVLPPGSGVKVGANPRQRVYDLQLRGQLDLSTLHGSARAATRGEWSSVSGDASHSLIRGARRITGKAKVQQDAVLRESDRGVIQPSDSVPDAGRFRSLAPESERIDLSLGAADRLASWLDGTLGARLSTIDSQSLVGAFVPAGVAERALEQENRNLSANANLALAAQAGSWSINLLADYAYLRRKTATDRRAIGEADPLASRTESRSESRSGELSAFGPLAQLPAGPSMVTVAGSIVSDRIEGERSFRGIDDDSDSRQTLSTLRGAVDLPIASRAAGVLGFLGELTASAEVSRQQASDFGSLDSHTLTLTWRPIEALLLTASTGRSASPPPIVSQDDPLVETPGVRTFDPLTGETVDVTWITGGIGGLRRQSDETKRFSARLKPVRSLMLQLTGEYVETSLRNEISELPTPSLSVLEAFPERFIRDPSGRLIVVDSRPVQFTSRKRRQLRTGFMLNLPLGGAQAGSAKPGGSDEGDDEGSDASARPARFGIRPRLQINASHTWLLDSELVLRDGQPAIDLLSQDAVGFGGLGQPRHRFDLTLGYAGRGLGVRAGIQYRSQSFIEANGSIDNVFRFEPLTSFTLRAWVQGERVDPDATWLKGTRLSLSVTNLTDVRERVVDRLGATPLAYQPAYRDPIGRTIEIGLRKKF
jgi:iron complex outermembrane recepter protein